MSKVKKIAVILVAIFLSVVIVGFVVGSIVNIIIPPSEAIVSDEVVEDIGGSNFLIATLDSCLKTGENNIPDGSFSTIDGDFQWFDAKNITYVDTDGRKGYMIVWKTTSDKYNNFKDKDVNQYVSTYLTDQNAKCFLEYSAEDHHVYGIIIGCDNIYYTESALMYDILGLNKTGFDLSYTDYSSSYSGGYSGSSDHYHTVVGDRYSVSRSDPDSYYDYYEYGDNYDIDNYLESEGYD